MTYAARGSRESVGHRARHRYLNTTPFFRTYTSHAAARRPPRQRRRSSREMCRNQRGYFGGQRLRYEYAASTSRSVR